MSQKVLQGLVNKIIPMSVVDGEGNRMAIFLQGCNFDCMYCHNPETIHLCIHCGRCVPGCPTKALTLEGNRVQWKEELCIDCDQCIDVCPHNSSPKVKWQTVDELAQEMEKALPFIEGITTSGGECTLQADFLVALFQKAHELNLTAFADTNGSMDLSKIEMAPLVEVVDGFLLDVKAWDEEEHKKLTGRGNSMVKKNLRYLSQGKKLRELRLVLLDGMDHEKTFQGIDENTAHKELVDLKLITYRPFGVREQYQHLKPISIEEEEKLIKKGKAMGFCQVLSV